MANRTSIEWCRTYEKDGSYTEGYTVNPIRFKPYGAERTTTMCQKVSPGCAHCYAETIVRRFWPGEEAFHGYTVAGVSSGDFVLDEKQLQSVLKIKKPCKIFWGDMTDLFHERVPFEMLDRCFAVCALTPHITHMFLTKRPEGMLKYCSDLDTRRRIGIAQVDMADKMKMPKNGIQLSIESRPDSTEDEPRLWSVWPLPNVWMGTSCENQEYADKRIPVLMEVPSVVHFISAEPLLGPIDFRKVPGFNRIGFSLDGWWVIAGGESGKGARIMQEHWLRSLRDQCANGLVPFFFKQWGSFIEIGCGLPDHARYKAGFRVGGKGGCLLDGKEHHEFPRGQAAW